MEIKKWLLSILFVTLTACGAGTEVVNTPNPNETPSSKKFENPYYSVVLEIPDGWTYIDYTTDTIPGEEAFSDDDPKTETIAFFSNGDDGFFTIFASLLDEEETLVDYVRERRPSGDLAITVVESERQRGTLAFIDQEEVGPRGGYVFDVYLAIESEILWMRTELLGSGEEMEATWNQFWEIVGSAKIE